jgi:iron complex transport system permease protein|nr:iron ABC transporter permease [Kofleriaceae bacterium]
MTQQFVGAHAARPLTRARLVGVVAACAVVAAVVAVVAPLVGAEVGRTGYHLQLLGPDALEPGSLDHTVLMLRVPRVLAALLVGGALAGAGCGLQALLRNPLAEPFTLGISSGSSLAAVLAIRLGLAGALGGLGVGLAALVGAAATLAAIAQLGRSGKALPPATVLLAGVTVSMFCGAASLLVQYTSDFAEVSHMLRWMLGGFDSTRLDTVGWAALPIGVGLVVLVAHARSLDALAAGPEAAASLGVSVARTEAVVFAVSSLLVGVAIAVAGPIGFVGLIVPHALRALFGPDNRLLLPASVFGGGVLLAVCDTLARTVTSPAPLPTGAVTAVLGGPFFVAILVGYKRKAAMWSR